MRIFTAFALALLALPLGLTSCSDDDHEPFQTLQECYDDHHNVESLPVLQAIVVCCLEHPIAGVAPSCKDTQAECVAHVDAQLDSSVTLGDIEAACTDYISEK